MCTGNESYAIVEYAPYQKVPSEKRKQDSKHNTIEKGTSRLLSVPLRLLLIAAQTDEDYISFMKALNAPTGEPVTLEALSKSI
jgi:regulator of nonsense transcripts 3